ncbi:MAG: GatB/YqeY domain-containing protein [Pseudomonadota bacterium]
MSLKEEIQSAMQSALKAKDTTTVSTLRMVLAAVKNKEIELRGTLGDSDVIQLINKQIKQGKDSIQQFSTSGRDDLVKKEEAEIVVLMAYMPKQLSEDAIDEKVASVIKELGAVNMKDMGRVMKTVMAQLAGKVDGNLVNAIVKRQLTS